MKPTHEELAAQLERAKGWLQKHNSYVAGYDHKAHCIHCDAPVTDHHPKCELVAFLLSQLPADSLREQSQALKDVLAERVKQDAKWGEQNHDPFIYLTVLVEEVGEFAQAALHNKFGGEKAMGLRTEAVQTAAVALAIIECLDRAKWQMPIDADSLREHDKKVRSDAVDHYDEVLADLRERNKQLITALDDAVKCFIEKETVVTPERLEAWQKVLGGK